MCQIRADKSHERIKKNFKTAGKRRPQAQACSRSWTFGRRESIPGKSSKYADEKVGKRTSLSDEKEDAHPAATDLV